LHPTHPAGRLLAGSVGFTTGLRSSKITELLGWAGEACPLGY